jgi:YD repeat-containing protein
MNKFLAFFVFLYVLSACTNKDQFTWENKYDDNGRLIKMIQPGGKNISFKYKMDDSNPDLVREMIKKGKGEKVVVEYDRFGRKTTMTDKIGKVDYEYDLAGNLSAVIRAGFPTVYYEYNTLGQLTSIKTDNGYFTNYEYDFLGRISGINSPAGKITYYYNRAQGVVQRRLPNGIMTQWLYGPDNSLQEIVHVDKNNYVLHSYSYTYSPEGLITQIDEQTKQGEVIKNYSYDSEQRLVVFTSSDGEKITYKYDKLG